MQKENYAYPQTWLRLPGISIENHCFIGLDLVFDSSLYVFELSAMLLPECLPGSES